MSSLYSYTRRIRAEKAATEALDKDLKKITAMTETAVKKKTPVVTGRLKNSITARRLGFLNYEVKTAVRYAPYVEFGTSKSSPRAMFRKGAKIISDRGISLLKHSRKYLK